MTHVKSGENPFKVPPHLGRRSLFFAQLQTGIRFASEQGFLTDFLRLRDNPQVPVTKEEWEKDYLNPIGLTKLEPVRTPPKPGRHGDHGGRRGARW